MSLSAARYTAVIFDMDGLMLDSERVVRQAMQDAAAELNVEFPDALFARLIGRNSVSVIDLLTRELGPAFPLAEFRLRSRQRFERLQATPGIAKKAGLDALLGWLAERATPKAVATSTARAEALNRLHNAGLLVHFPALVGGDEVQQGKPAPDIYLAAAAKLAVEPARCIVLEDSEPGIEAAHAAGMLPLWVPDLCPDSARCRELAGGVFASLVEVRAHLAVLLATDR